MERERLVDRKKFTDVVEYSTASITNWQSLQDLL
jgi:hypothetical protein